MSEKIPVSLKEVEECEEVPQIKRSNKRRNAIIMNHPVIIPEENGKIIQEGGTQSSLGNVTSDPKI